MNGPICDRIGGKRIFLLGMLGAILSNILFTRMSDLTMFIFVWCICRYFLSMGWGGIVKIVGSEFPPQQNGTVMGIVSISFQIGGVISALFSGLLIAMGMGWRELFIYPAIVLTFIMLVSWIMLKEDSADRSSVHQLSIADQVKKKSNQTENIFIFLLKIPIFKQMLIFAFFTTFLRSVFLFWIPKFLVDIGMQEGAAILSSSVFPLLGCIGTIALGWYTDRHIKNGDRAQAMWILLLGLVVCLGAIAILISGAHYNGFLIVTLLGLSGFFLLGPYSMSAGCLALDIAGAKYVATAAGIVDGLGYFGGAIAVWMTGQLSDKLGWGQVFWILCALSVLSTLTAVWMSYTFSQIHRRRCSTKSGR